MSNIISWEQAYSDFQHNKKEDIEKVKRIIDEIETSDFTFLDAYDIHHYAEMLNEYSNRKYTKGKLIGKPNPYTANEIRRINMKARNENGFHFMHTFINDETDDIFDFY